MFLDNIVDERISRAINNDHTAAMKATDKRKRIRKKSCNPSSSENNTTCLICKKTFPDHLMCRKHIRMHGDKSFLCQMCGKGFAVKNYLQAHMITHGKNPHYQCSMCHKKFAHKGNFNQHLKLHGNKKPFRCDLCKKNFFQEKHYNLHQRLHNNERPFVCEICHKSFNIKSSLQRHMNCHTGAKPFICDICNRGYTRRSVLVLHIQQVHENIKPFKCEECQLCFSQKGNLQAHYRRKHLKTSPENTQNKESIKTKKSIKKHKNSSKKHKAFINKNIITHTNDNAHKLKTNKVADTSLHSYASKVKAIINRNTSRTLDSSLEKKAVNKVEQNLNLKDIKKERTMDNNDSCKQSKNMSDISSNNCITNDIPDLDFSSLLESHLDNAYDYLKSSLCDFDALIADEKCWSNNLLEDTDVIFNPTLSQSVNPTSSHCEMSENLSSPSKTNNLINKLTSDENELFPNLGLTFGQDDAVSASLFPIDNLDDSFEFNKNSESQKCKKQDISQNTNSNALKTINSMNVSINMLLGNTSLQA